MPPQLAVYEKINYKKAADVLLNYAKKMPTQRSFINKMIDKISGQKEQSQPITFKAYEEVLATLDTYKKSVIAKIELQNNNKNHPSIHKKKIHQADLDMDI